MGYQVTTQSEILFTNCVLSDIWSHKVECEWQYSVLKWNWFICDQAWTCPQKPKLRDRKKWPKGPWSPLLLHWLLYPACIYSLMRISLFSWQKKKSLGSGLKVFFMISRHHWKLDCNTTIIFWDILVGQGWKEILPVDRASSSVYMCVCVCVCVSVCVCVCIYI